MEPRRDCTDTLPDLPTDRGCVRPQGHPGDHNDGAYTWTSAESDAVRGAVGRVERALIADAPRVAREAVLHGHQVKSDAARAMKGEGEGNRAERRKAFKLLRGKA